MEFDRGSAGAESSVSSLTDDSELKIKSTIGATASAASRPEVLVEDVVLSLPSVVEQQVDHHDPKDFVDDGDMARGRDRHQLQQVQIKGKRSTTVSTGATKLALSKIGEDDEERDETTLGDDNINDEHDEEESTPAFLPTKKADGKPQLMVGRDQEQKQLMDIWKRVIQGSRGTYADDFDTAAATAGYNKATKLQTGEEEDTTTIASESKSSTSRRGISGVGGELVHIQGESGTGKSCLVESMRHPVVVESGGIFVSSKFDQWSSGRFPFHALVDVLTDLCEVLAWRPDAQRIGKQLLQELGPSDWTLFTQFVSVPLVLRQAAAAASSAVNVTTSPATSLHDGVGVQVRGGFRSSNTSNSVASSTITAAAAAAASSALHQYSAQPFQRLQGACRQFLRFVARMQPLLIFLDDIQWADDECMTMIRSLLKLILVPDQKSSRGGHEHQQLSQQEDEILPRLPIMFVVASRTSSQSEEDRFMPLSSSSHSRNKGSASLQALFKDGYGRKTTQIALNNWNQAQVHEYISKLLSMPLDELGTSQVGAIVYEKTGGNPFWVLQFLELLHVKGWIGWSRLEQRWEWKHADTQTKNNDLARDIVRLDGSEGVLSSVNARLYELSSRTRSILVLAAHLGFSFRKDVLMVVAKDYQARFSNRSIGSSTTESTPEPPSNVVEDALQEAEQASLIIRCKPHGTVGAMNHNTTSSNMYYYFMHDRVQESLYEMVAEGELKERLCLRIGRFLRDALKREHFGRQYTYLVGSGTEQGGEEEVAEEQHRDNSIVIVVVDTLNQGRPQMTDHKELLELVRLNIRAAETASSALSFASAASYLTIAANLIPEALIWSEYYELALDLHEKLARMKCNCGKPDEAHPVLDLVMQNAHSIADKQTGYHIRFLAYSLQGENELSLAAALAALRELGVTSIQEKPSMTNIMGKVAKINWLMRGRTIGRLLHLPPMTNYRSLSTQSLLRHIIVQAGVVDNEPLCLVAIAEMFALTLQHGRSKWTPSATAAFGVLQYAVFQNVSKAHETGRVAIEMILAFGDEAEADTAFTFLLSYWSLLWRSPVSSSIQPLKRGFESGIQHGDTYNAITNLALSLVARLLAGLPLGETEREMAQCTKRMAEFSGRNSVLLWSNCNWQTTMNLMGRCEDPLALSGDAMSERDILEESAIRDGKYGVARVTFLYAKLQLACHFRSLETAATVLEELEREKVTFQLFAPDFVTLSFYSALTHLDLARAHTKAGRRRHMSKAKKSYKVMRNLVADQCHYATALMGLLEAEMKFVRTGSMDKQLYEKAIRTVLNGGFLNYAGIGYERAGLALLEQRKGISDSEIRDYLRKGFNMNQQWEAFGKVEWYHETYMAKDEGAAAPDMAAGPTRAILQQQQPSLSTKKQSGVAAKEVTSTDTGM